VGPFWKVFCVPTWKRSLMPLGNLRFLTSRLYVLATISCHWEKATSSSDILKIGAHGKDILYQCWFLSFSVKNALVNFQRVMDWVLASYFRNVLFLWPYLLLICLVFKVFPTSFPPILYLVLPSNLLVCSMQLPYHSIFTCPKICRLLQLRTIVMHWCPEENKWDY
jgi:hypothetical protein